MLNTNYANNDKKIIIIKDIMGNNKNIGNNCEIHSTVVIEDGAIIGNNVKIGAFSVIGKNVKIGDNCILKPHTVIEGHTTIGNGNKIFSFATIGQDPQDLKYHGEKSEIVIGNNNSIREHCTIHPGTEGDNLLTKIGNNNLLMVNTHIAHDCVIGNNCVFANNATLAGHVHIGNNVVLGGLSAIHQFVKVGDGAMLGGLSGLGEDLIPYGMAYVQNGRRSSLQGLNLVGLKRSGIAKEEIHNLMHYYKEVFEDKSSTPLIERSQEIRKNYQDSKLVNEVADFLGTDSSRRFCTVRQSNDKE